jgi:hypothetical protein
MPLSIFAQRLTRVLGIGNWELGIGNCLRLYFMLDESGYN